ncbi:MAG: tetratricopeptide repeat protein [Chloroflexota bacterium]|nr:tetratricopeptide repeat protein [Chloroflexota bacterium]
MLPTESSMPGAEGPGHTVPASHDPPSISSAISAASLPSVGGSEPSSLDAVLALVLVGALVASIILLSNNSDVAGRFALRHAQSLLAMGHYTDAEHLLESTLPRYSTPEVRLLLSYAYLARRDAVRAERQSTLALQGATPDLLPALFNQLGRVLASEGHTAEAEAAWRHSVDAALRYSDSRPVALQSRSSLWQLSMLAWRQGDWSKARQLLEKLTDGNDVYASSSQIKLAQLLAPTEPSTSLKWLDIAEGRLKQAAVPATVGGGNVMERGAIPDMRLPDLGEGLPLDSISALVLALRSSFAGATQLPLNANANGEADVYWGNFYLQTGEPQLAVLYLRRGVAQNPTHAAYAQAQIAAALLGTGDSKGALLAANAAVRADARNPLVHHILVRLYIAQQQWPQAQSELDALSNLEPGSVEVQLERAQYYTARGMYDDAERAYRDAVDAQRAQVSSTDAVDAALAQSRFYTDVRGMGCERGLPAARESLLAHPDDPASLDAVGWSTLLCRRASEAIPDLQKALHLAPDVPRYMYHLGRALAEAGQYADAMSAYNRVSDLDPTGPWEHVALQARAELP